MTTNVNNSTLCHANQGTKVSVATAAPDVTFLTPTLSHLNGQSDIAKMLDVMIVLWINLFVVSPLKESRKT